MGASAPNLSLTGFQTSVTTNPRPKALTAGQEPMIRAMMTPTSNARTAMAKNVVVPRNRLSCVRWRRPCPSVVTRGSLSVMLAMLAAHFLWQKTYGEKAIDGRFAGMDCPGLQGGPPPQSHEAS